MKKGEHFKLNSIFLMCIILVAFGLCLIFFQEEINSAVKSYLKDKPLQICESREML